MKFWDIKVAPVSKVISDGLIIKPEDLVPTGTQREGRAEFRLARDVWFEDVVVPKGYVTDKHSLPGFVKAWQPKGAQWAGPPIIHDWLFETKLKSMTEANQCYLRAMRAIGVMPHHRFIAYVGVQLGGHAGFGVVDADNIDMIEAISSEPVVKKERKVARKAMYLAYRAAKTAGRVYGIPIP